MAENHITNTGYDREDAYFHEKDLALLAKRRAELDANRGDSAAGKIKCPRCGSDMIEVPTFRASHAHIPGKAGLTPGLAKTIRSLSELACSHRIYPGLVLALFAVRAPLFRQSLRERLKSFTATVALTPRFCRHSINADSSSKRAVHRSNIKCWRLIPVASKAGR